MIVVIENTQNNSFIQIKSHLLVVEFSKKFTFLKNAHFDVILTSVMIIKLDFLCKSFCNKSLVGSEISKHQNIGTSYSLGSSDAITYVNTITLINLQKFL